MSRTKLFANQILLLFVHFMLKIKTVLLIKIRKSTKTNFVLGDRIGELKNNNFF